MLDATWSICSHKGAFHTAHVDTGGVFTGTHIAEGTKLWITLVKKDGSTCLDLNSNDCIPNIWHEYEVNPDLYDAEYILLQSGDTL